MKKNLILISLLFLAGTMAAQNKAELKFDESTHDFGTFSQDSAVVSYNFAFTNVGNAPLIIHQAVASCGCTIPEYTLEPIQPGKKGVLKVTYDGSTKRPGVFRKSITIHNNGVVTPVRIYIKGEMTPAIPDFEKIINEQDSTSQVKKPAVAADSIH